MMCSALETSKREEMNYFRNLSAIPELSGYIGSSSFSKPSLKEGSKENGKGLTTTENNANQRERSIDNNRNGVETSLTSTPSKSENSSSTDSFYKTVHIPSYHNLVHDLPAPSPSLQNSDYYQWGDIDFSKKIDEQRQL